MADLISTLTPDTQDKVRTLIALAEERYGYKVKVVSARRSCEEQAKIYAQGRTAPGKIISNAKGCLSWHVLGRAVDLSFVSPNPTAADWDNLGEIGESLGFKWGKRFSGTLNDLPHFEYHPGVTIEQVCPNPDDCEGGVSQSMGGSASSDGMWPALAAFAAGFIVGYMVI